MAAGIAESLVKTGIKISQDDIEKGIAETYWPGRCEIIRNENIFLLDGAHAPQAVDGLVGTIQKTWPEKKVLLIWC